MPSYIPDFDPYGFSPYDPHAQYQQRDPDYPSNRHDYNHDPFDDYKPKDSRRSSSKPSRHYDEDSDQDSRRHGSKSGSHRSKSKKDSRRRKVESDSDDADSESDSSYNQKRGSRRRGAPKPRSHRSSRAKDDYRDYPREKGESEWDDTDYDPRDKYYLSGDEDYDRSPTRKYTADNYKPKPKSKSESNHNSGSRSNRRPGPSRYASTVSAVGDRNDPSSTRPRAIARHSSYSGRPRSARYGERSSGGGDRDRDQGSGSKRRQQRRQPSRGLSAEYGDGGTWGGGTSHDHWNNAMRSALKAGAIAALKVSTQQGTLYDKLPRVATAAVGAAVVDAFLTKKHPKKRGGMRHAAMRQAAELAIGNMLAKPTAKEIRRARHHK